MRIIFARHAQSEANLNHLLDTAVPGVPLNATGHEQAERLADRLAAEPITAIYATPIARSQETARPLAQRLGLPVQILDGLREIEAGEDEMAAHWQRYVNTLAAWLDGNWEVSIPGGPSAADFYQRYDGAVAEIAASGHECVLVVTHGGALRTWLGNRVLELREATRNRRLENTATIIINGSPGAWTWESWDDQLAEAVSNEHHDVPD